MGVRPPVLPLLAALALAAIMCLPIGYSWAELQEGMFEALGRIQIAIAILILVGMIIAAWMASGTIPAIIYWGLKLLSPQYFLLSAMLLCSMASLATGTSFGTMRSEEHTSELQSRTYLVCRLLLEKKKN